MRSRDEARPDAARLVAGLPAAEGRERPPVDLWSPPFCGDLPMVIKRDGTWLYKGSPIARHRMVELFASILRRDEDGRFYLVTPVEKCGISVEDAPFLAVDCTVDGQGRAQNVAFRTNVDDRVTMGAEHPLRVDIDPMTEEPSPYIHIRGRLEALIARPAFYDLVELGIVERVEGEDKLGVWSAGMFFPIAPAVDLKSPHGE